MGGAASAPGRIRGLPRGPGACRFSHGVTGYISGIYGAQVAAYWLGMVGG